MILDTVLVDVPGDKEAFSLLTQQGVDIAILGEAILERMRDLLHALSSQGRQLPHIIVLSTSPDISKAVEAMHLGVSDYLVAPFDTRRLEEALRRGIERASLRRELAATLPSDQVIAKASYPKLAAAAHTLVLTAEESQTLTPHYLAAMISPYLTAIADIQYLIDEMHGRQPRELVIKSIQQESPISVSLDGAAEAVQVVQDNVIPWRRKHAETMARLLEQEKQAEIESKRAEVLGKRASASKSRAEVEKLATEVAKQREEAEKMRLENEKVRLELHRAKIQLALDMLNLLAPQMSETERIAYLIKLLPPLDIVIFSNLEITTIRGAG